MNVFMCLSCMKMVLSIGKWSDDIFFQEALLVSWADIIVRFGDLGF